MGAADPERNRRNRDAAYEFTIPEGNAFSPVVSPQWPWTRGFCKLPEGAPRPVRGFQRRHLRMGHRDGPPRLAGAAHLPKGPGPFRDVMACEASPGADFC